MGVYSNFRGRRIDLTETLAYHLAAVTSLAHLSVAYTSFIMKWQQGILHAENAVGMCFLCLKIRSNGLETFRPGKSRGVGVSIIFILFAVLRYSEPPMSPSFCCWSEYVFRSGNLFRGTNQPLAPKTECHHHSGNMSTPIFHLPLRRRVPDIFFCRSTKSERSRLTGSTSWILSDRDTMGSSNSCHRCFLSDRELTHCRNKFLRPVPHLLCALWCHRHRW